MLSLYAMLVVVQSSVTDPSKAGNSLMCHRKDLISYQVEHLNPLKIRECAIGSGQSRTSKVPSP